MIGLQPHGAERWEAATAVLGGVVVAAAFAAAGPGAALVAAAVPMAVVATGAVAARVARIWAPARVVGVVVLLLVASTFVWRVRSTQALDANPLDAAAAVRVALVLAAALLACALLLAANLARARLPLSLRLVGLYVVVAGLAAVGSPSQLQALYRVFELGVGLGAVVLAVRLLGRRAGQRLLELVVGSVTAIVCVIWVEALIVPSRAWQPIGSFVPYELTGTLPDFAANTVGLLGGVVAVWGLARVGTGRRGAVVANVELALGTATVLASQYRTGLIGLLAAGSVVAWHRRRRVFLLLLACSALFVLFVGAGQVRDRTETAFARGRPEMVASLDGRVGYWHAALPVIGERPVLGWGLNVASRRVLVSLGEDTTSTVHGTWIEALLGTGVLGAGLLAAAFLVALRDAWTVRHEALGIACVGLLALLVVRSITGSTAELFDLGFLLFAALALAAAQLREAGLR